MPHLTLTFPDERRCFAPGETLDLTLDWEIDGPSKAIEVLLFWYTSGKGDQDLQVVQTHHIANPRNRDTEAIRFELPQGPFSFSGQLISLTWVVEGDVKGHADVTCRHEFTLSPSGGELLLHGQSALLQAPESP